MHFTLTYKSSVKKELRKLPQTDRIVIIHKITLLAIDPRPEGSAKLKGSHDLFRIRHGDYRIVYQIKDGLLTIIIIRIGHRRDIYKKL